MSVEVVAGLITLLEANSTLQSELGWTDEDKRIYRFFRQMPLLIPEILIEELSSTSDDMAPRSTEDKADLDLYAVTIVAADATSAENMENKVRGIFRVVPTVAGRRCFRFKRVARNEFFDVPTKSHRRVLHYSCRTIYR